MYRYLLIFIFISCITAVKSQTHVVTGMVTESQTQRPIENVVVRASNLPYSAITDRYGNFLLKLPERESYKLIFSNLAYQSFTRELKFKGPDTLRMVIELLQRPALLDSVSVFAKNKPETLVAKPNYSIFDFDFYENKLLLLTAERSLANARIQLSDYSGNILISCALPKSAGEAKYFFHDYEGYTDVVCKDSVFRLDVMNKELMVMPIPKKDFQRYLLPVADTLNANYYYNDKWDQYPLFNYYYLKKNDTTSHLLNTITNADLMKLYNLEYYYLPPQLQLEARRIEQYRKVDRHIAAALMSGFTQTMFYEPLYAPLFILNDTICIFNHYNNFLYHYNRNNSLIDSVQISYHHPKNWREWKKQLFVDETENKVYAFFSKDGHHYLKNINYHNGKENGTYKLKFHSAEKIKIKDGYAYYVYRPFGSTQERFLYRERIE